MQKAYLWVAIAQQSLHYSPSNGGSKHNQVLTIALYIHLIYGEGVPGVDGDSLVGPGDLIRWLKQVFGGIHTNQNMGVVLQLIWHETGVVPQQYGRLSSNEEHSLTDILDVVMG